MVNKNPPKKKHTSLIMGQLLAQVSDRMTGLGLIWVVTKEFGETWVTWYLVVGGLPHLLLSAISPRLIHRFGALQTVVLADVLRACIYFAAALIFQSIEGPRELLFIFFLIFLANSFSALFNPAILTLPLELENGAGVQKLTAQLSTVTSLVTVVGPILGMMCFQALGLRGLFLVTAGSYLLSGWLAWTLRGQTSTAIGNAESPIPSTNNSKLRVTMRESLRKNPLVFVMLLVFLAMNLLLSPLQVQMPSMANTIFAGSFNMLAAMETALGFGIVCGGLVLTLKSIQKRELYWTWIFLIGIAFFFLVFQSLQYFLVSIASLALMGLFVGLANLLIINIFQSRPRPEDVPNIMSLVNLISVAAVPVSLIAIGLLQAKFSLASLGMGCAILLFVICGAGYWPFRSRGKELFF